MRVIDRQGDIWGTMTPLMGLTWVHDVIYLNLPQDPEVWCQSMQWEDNPFLRGEEIARLVATMSPQEREARQYGRFAGLAGLVYNAFSPDTHVIDPFDVPHAWYDNIAIDPGFTNPLSCHFYACDGDGNVYVVAEHYRAGAMVEEHACAIDAIARQLGWPRDGKGRLRALMDSAASQHTLAAERSVAELFYDHGIIPNLRVNKDKFTGIQRVKEYLKLRPAQDAAAWPRGKPRLFIFRTCPHMIREMQTYRWAIGEDAPQKVNDHAMDELRYYIMNRPEPYREPAPPKSAIALHKERLIAAARRNRRIT